MQLLALVITGALALTPVSTVTWVDGGEASSVHCSYDDSMGGGRVTYCTWKIVPIDHLRVKVNADKAVGLPARVTYKLTVRKTACYTAVARVHRSTTPDQPMLLQLKRGAYWTAGDVDLTKGQTEKLQASLYPARHGRYITYVVRSVGIKVVHHEDC